MWENLTKVVELHKLSWVIAGDFNEPLIDKDKFEGRGVNINRSLAFKDCLDRCSMVDMGFSGPRYTWTNKRDISNLILERIDKFFMNDVHEIYTIKYSHIYIFSLTFMLFYDWLYIIFVLQVTRALHAKWG